MTTVASRTFRSSPYRDALQTWVAIVDLLTQRKQTNARRELEAVTGIAASCIADKVPKFAPMIITCEGPRTRVYCLYDDDAIDGADANEERLGFDPLKGEWTVSLPCDKEDLEWVSSALKKHSTRITARDLTKRISDESKDSDSTSELTIDLEGFLRK